MPSQASTSSAQHDSPWAQVQTHHCRLLRSKTTSLIQIRSVQLTQQAMIAALPTQTARFTIQSRLACVSAMHSETHSSGVVHSLLASSRSVSGKEMLSDHLQRVLVLTSTRQRPPTLAQRFVGSLRRTLTRKRDTPVFFNMNHARSGKVTDAHFYAPPASAVDPVPSAPPSHRTESVFSQFKEHVDAPTHPASTRPPSMSQEGSFAGQAQASPVYTDLHISASSYVRPARTASGSTQFGFRAASRRSSAATSQVPSHAPATVRQTRSPIVAFTDSDRLAQRYTDKLRGMQDAASTVSKLSVLDPTDESAVPVQHPSKQSRKPDSDSGSEFGFPKDGTAKRPHSWDLQDMLKHRRDRTASQETNQVLNNWSDSSEEEQMPIPMATAAPAMPVATPPSPKSTTPKSHKSKQATPKFKSPKQTPARPTQHASPDRRVFGELLNSARKATRSAQKTWSRTPGRPTPKTASQRQFSRDLRQSHTPNGKHVTSAIRNYEEKVAKESMESRRSSSAFQSFTGTVPRTAPILFDLEDAVESHFGPVDAWRARVHDQENHSYESGAMLL
ncbi:hypothetical protein BCR37DRAFT_299891 [Protomyces lactucae-debilis]|uniref:Uncharacterized protein n=1 Tax=Protomyces lactucae-debilis TaxID=2754530 RepID=A0A1Y2FK94_PROLT|nr:uncharacterized protein BCR37DRAFT_299891 [Protomyces lactucae-debilis]ORY83215.1 hypothetical protein BCR37DRAFT_299891 [Protomyces lactucae-debilis]